MTLNILTAEDLDNINRALELIKVLKQELKRATQAGVKVDFSEEDLKAREAQLLALKRAYFPTGKAEQSE